MQTTTLSMETPIGAYLITAQAAGVTRFQPTRFQPDGGTVRGSEAAGDTRSRRVAESAREAFAAWFAGDCLALEAIALAPAGTGFREQVWRELRKIPVGRTASYGEIARRIGRPGAARAVGAANHHNPIAIAIPCHRVIGGDGRLVGYAGGVERKEWLLAHEARWRLAGEPTGGVPGQAASSKSKMPSTRAECAVARSFDRADASI